VSKKKILFVGDRDSPPFRTVVGWLESGGTLRCLTSISAAQLACRDDPPHLIVIGQLRPGEFTSEEVERLHREAPLARLVALLGSWCEGETRTGTPWPGVTRLYWHQLTARAVQELIGARSGKWALPRTSTDVERLMSYTPIRQVNQGLIVVRSESHLSFDALSDALVLAGYAAVRVRGNEPFAAVGTVAGIWDCTLSICEDREPLTRFVDQLRPAPVIGLLGFPRDDDRQAALECGVRLILGKPLVVEDLVNELLSQSACPQRRGAELRNSA
jgi:hypothetical protein